MLFRTIRDWCSFGRGVPQRSQDRRRRGRSAGPPTSTALDAGRTHREGPYTRAAVFLAGAAIVVTCVLSAAQNAWWPFPQTSGNDRLTVAVVTPPGWERPPADGCRAVARPSPNPGPSTDLAATQPDPTDP
jgi:hypothetical protein